jgi:hypothetical protein
MKSAGSGINLADLGWRVSPGQPAYLTGFRNEGGEVPRPVEFSTPRQENTAGCGASPAVIGSR